ncbi:hypothetical protein EPD60_09265 [Flaviaesturariibacter flavus]|uniref:Uncharacterized protein n=1 Tax=Flaviaesturariibacter flavus TaxID=2502780 RepID=A0A4R1BB15_9BACT|nr:polysaccharide biosynthesis C-terminal domain-containing protein [Flaviaesturariibacter flavus]TCJ14186.1 hypothetical protein EPD60_09265 [Flaviaesturariibacter flavus]
MKFLKQLSLYTIVGVVSAGVNFFIMPVLSHYLSPADYGLFSLFNSYISILIPIVSLSAYSIINVDYYTKKDDRAFARQFSSLQLIPVFNALVLAIGAWLFYSRLMAPLELERAGSHWGYIIIALTLISIFNEQFSVFLVIQKKAGLFAFYSLLKTALEIGLTVLFVVKLDMGWEGRMYSWLIGSLVHFVLGTLYFYRQGMLTTQLEWRYVRQGLLFGAPLVLHGVGKFVVNQSDRLFIVKLVPHGLDEAGIYGIGYTVGMLVMVAINAFFNFYTPFQMEKLADGSSESKLQIVKVGYVYVGISVALLAGLAIFSPILFHYFIDERYAGGLKYVFWVGLGYIFWGGYMLFSGVIFYLKRSGILGWLAIFNVVSNILFNLFFIRYFGAIGAAYATALSFFLLMMVVAWIAQRLIPLPWLQFKKVKQAALS